MREETYKKTGSRCSIKISYGETESEINFYKSDMPYLETVTLENSHIPYFMEVFINAGYTKIEE